MLAPAQQPFLASQPQNVTAHSTHHSDGSYMPAIVILVVITCLSIASCIMGRICSRGWNDQVSNDLEKGLGIAKADATKLKNKDAAEIKQKMMSTSKCELHGNKINFKNIISAKNTASDTLKKQGLNRCELHGVYLSRHNNASAVSGTNDKEQASMNSN